MKTMLKTVLMFILISTLSVSAFASTVNLQWNYLNTIISSLSITELGIAQPSGSVTLQKGNNVSVEMNLQQLKSNGWVTIKTWTGSGKKSCLINGSYAVYSGYEYRTEIIGIVYDSNGNEIERSKMYSSIKKY